MLYGIPYTQNLKNNTNDFIYEIETDSQTHTESKLKVTKRERDGGRMNQEYRINRHKGLYNKQQGFTIQHRKRYSVSCNNLQWKTT